MKKSKKILIASICTVIAVNAASVSVSAADTDIIYGTMQIPYADFFAAEFADADNSDVEVDAVSSATTSKWAMNNTGSFDEDGTWESGGLAAGTYCTEADENGGGQILGVVYPVAITQADLDALGDNNYGFTALDEVPIAYKEVTVDNGTVSFSKLVDTDGAVEVGGDVTLQTQTTYGDYQIQVENYPQDADTYAAIIKTTDGNYYAMRALENIWRNGEYAWSVGYVTTVHGNSIDNPDYYDTNGATITEIDIITLDGYRTISDVNLYLPEIFTDSVDVADGTSGTSSVTFDDSIFPSDFVLSGSVADGFTVDGNTISYENVQPGSYTLTVSDTSGKYADVKGTFLLETSGIPVEYRDGKLVTKDGFTDEDAANYLQNIISVTVGDTTYTTGRGGTTVIDSTTGEVLFDAVLSGTPVFDGSGEYTITVNSTGYTQDYSFSIIDAGESTTENTTEDSTDDTSTTTTTTTTTAATTRTTTTTTKTSTTSTTSDSTSPETNDASAVGAFSLAAIASAICFAISRKKNQ